MLTTVHNRVSRRLLPLLMVLAMSAAMAAQGGSIVTQAQAGRNAALEHYPDAVLSVSGEGIDVAVADDGHTLEARDRNGGKPLWFTDVLKENGTPSAGFPVIRHVEITKAGTVSVVVGKARVIEIDLKTGKVLSLAED